MNVVRSAAGDGLKPFASNFARMKESMGVRIQLWSLTDRSEGRASRRNDHQSSWRFCARNGVARIKFQLSKTAEPAETLSKKRICHPSCMTLAYARVSRSDKSLWPPTSVRR